MQSNISRPTSDSTGWDEDRAPQRSRGDFQSRSPDALIEVTGVASDQREARERVTFKERREQMNPFKLGECEHTFLHFAALLGVDLG